MIIFISPPFGNYFKYFKINAGEDIGTVEFVPIKGSFTLQKRDGLISQIFKTLRYSTEYQGWINKIGLRNKGIDYAIEKYKNDNSIVSVAVLNQLEVPILLNKIPNDMDIELNVSCPNVGNQICDIGIDRFINRYRNRCIIKLSPMTDTKVIDSYYKMGFREFHCSNTFPTKDGGVSGEILRPYTEDLTRYIKDNYTDTKVICGGGIKTKKDIENYKAVGGDYFSISTLCFSPIRFIKLLFEL